MIAVSINEVIVIYLIPIAFLFGLWFLASLVIYLLVRSKLDFDFKHDLLRKFDEKRGLPSGRDRLSFLYVAKILLGDSCVQAVFLYRTSRFFATHRVRPLAEVVNSFSRLVTHTDISPWSNIAPGLYLYHGLGTVIGKTSRIGRRATICQGVSIGGGVTLGDDVSVWAGAQILRGVAIGDRTEVGANAVVMNDFPADVVVFGVPARLAGAKPAAVLSDPDAHEPAPSPDSPTASPPSV
jgi:serine O-acetyltransferase